jgi:hypothetical protein
MTGLLANVFCQPEVCGEHSRVQVSLLSGGDQLPGRYLVPRST